MPRTIYRIYNPPDDFSFCFQEETTAKDSELLWVKRTASILNSIKKIETVVIDIDGTLGRCPGHPYTSILLQKKMAKKQLPINTPKL